MASGFQSDKVDVFIGDGFEYLKQRENEFDVIITDSSDPVGPGIPHTPPSFLTLTAESLFQPKFFGLIQKALRKDGLLCSQGECMWLHLDIISSVLKEVGQLFPVMEYGYTTLPTYPCGQIGFIIASKNAKVRIVFAHI